MRWPFLGLVCLATIAAACTATLNVDLPGNDEPDPEPSLVPACGLVGLTDTSGAIFVHPLGSDTAAGTSPAAALASVDAALALASSSGSPIHIAEGTWPVTRDLPDGVTLRGGYAASDWAIRDPYESVTVLSVGTGGLRAVGLESEVLLEGVRIVSAPGAPSTYALFVRDADVSLVCGDLAAGDAGPGRDGAPGAPAPTPVPAGAGANGGDGGGGGAGGVCTDDAERSRGGAGGVGGVALVRVAGPGGDASDPEGGTGGEADGGTGNPGATPPPAATPTPPRPTGGEVIGALEPDGWVSSPGLDGLNGVAGRGGGGGAGGVNGAGNGGGGGGGGGGGCGGRGGGGGEGGGASIGAYLFSGVLQIRATRISAGAGGAGGNGALGGEGSPGGDGAAPGAGAPNLLGNGLEGGAGGAGEAGGAGGHGGGGAGGPSISVVVGPGAAYVRLTDDDGVDRNQLVFGPPGLGGGPGDGGNVGVGANGLAVTVLNAGGE